MFKSASKIGWAKKDIYLLFKVTVAGEGRRGTQKVGGGAFYGRTKKKRRPRNHISHSFVKKRNDDR